MALRPPRQPQPPSYVPVQRVDVNFITYPFEAEIHLDGKRVLDEWGAPMLTPCTVQGLEARSYRLVFKKAGRPDLDVGPVDLSSREVEMRWPEAPRDP